MYEARHLPVQNLRPAAPTGAKLNKPMKVCTRRHGFATHPPWRHGWEPASAARPCRAGAVCASTYLSWRIMGTGAVKFWLWLVVQRADQTRAHRRFSCLAAVPVLWLWGQESWHMEPEC